MTLAGVELVLIGGGLGQSGDTLLAPLRTEVTGRLTWQRTPRIERAALGDRAGTARRGVPCVGRLVIITVARNPAVDVTYEVGTATAFELSTSEPAAKE